MNEKVHKISKWLDSGSINIFGCPFAGKDTQARKLATLLNGDLIAGGDILRSHEDQAMIEQIMDSGGLIPSEFYFNLVLPYLSQPKFKNKPLVLSSVGRLQGEEPTILKATKDSGHITKAAIVLKLSEAEVWKRFETAKNTLHDRGGRDDDDRNVIATRLTNFKKKTRPVIEFYRRKGLLIEVDGSKSRDDVTTEIIDKLAAAASK